MSGMIPKEFTNELLARIDIIEIIDARVPLKKAGTNFLACCPFHKEKTPSFSVNQTKQFYHCFGCGKSGNAITFLIEFEHLSFVESVESLAHHIGMQVPYQKSNSKPKPSFTPLYDLMQRISEYFQTELQQSDKALQYLHNRGLTKETIKTFGIGYACSGWDNLLKQFNTNAENLSILQQAGMIIENQSGGFYDRFRDRIMFPILDRQGRTIGFGGRVFDDSTPKYLNSPETPIFHKGRELYGLYHANKANPNLQSMLIVEGYMDTIALAQYGITNTGATLGTATTEQHLELLFRYTSNIVFCFDGDNAGKKAAWRALETTLKAIVDGIQVKFLFLPDNEDPDSLIRKEGNAAFSERLNEAQTLSQFFFKHLQENCDLTHMDGKALFLKMAKPYIDNMPSSILRQMMIDELARLTRVNPQTIFKANEKTVSKLSPSQPPNRKKSMRLTPVRLAVALLVHYPHLCSYLNDTGLLCDSSIPGVDLLLNIHEIVSVTPNITTAMLLEHWRDHEIGSYLSKLLSFEHIIPNQGIEDEFIGALKRICQQVLEQKIEQLMQKGASVELTDTEKQTLTHLIAELKNGPKIVKTEKN